MNDSAAVLFVNEAFYAAFRDGDAETMDALWAQEVPVACVHPGWRSLAGRTEVMDSWQAILFNPDTPDIHCRDAQAFVMGRWAFVVCYEMLGVAVLVATNLFIKEAGNWKLVHHHAGPCNAPPDFEEEDSDTGALQ